jgi:hypothetical protein
VRRRAGWFEKSGARPKGFALETYTTIQICAQAAEAAKSLKLPDLVKALQATTFETGHGRDQVRRKGRYQARRLRGLAVAWRRICRALRARLGDCS